ncbi:MAG: fumarylacetoacetate hydrolase family protein [Polaromonas sp.]|nr:fumarylacetoacetate hydrolase family protein [Polaromonas sp.]
MTLSTLAQRLIAARRSHTPLNGHDVLPASAADAYGVQDLTVAELGAIGGWKVGAKNATAEPTCAPLPLAGLLPSGARLTGNAWQLRGIEVEAALRLGRDLDPQDNWLSPEELIPFFDAVLPVIEVVETRLLDRANCDPLTQLADLQSHGALILGAPSPLPTQPLDLRTLQAHLWLDGAPTASTLGGNPAADLWRLIAWLALHCAQRGHPLRAGQIITTGSCTGLVCALEGAHVKAKVVGLGCVELRF